MEMTTSELIIAFGSTGVGSLIIGWWLNKKREDIEINLKEQVFYKNLIKDIEEQRVKEKNSYINELTKLRKEIVLLKESLKLINKKFKDKNSEIDKWEKYCTQLRESLLFEKKKHEKKKVKK